MAGVAAGARIFPHRFQKPYGCPASVDLVLGYLH